jgi:hypothetical protein
MCRLSVRVWNVQLTQAVSDITAIDSFSAPRIRRKQSMSGGGHARRAFEVCLRKKPSQPATN